MISDWLSINCKNCLAQTPKFGQLENHTNNLSDCQGALERIINTPIPSSYVGHLTQLLSAYLFTLPFCLLDDYYWMSILAVGMISYGLLGIDAAGVLLEDPFGDDEGVDLPLDKMCIGLHDLLMYISKSKEIAVVEVK